MSIERITISVPKETAAKIKKAARGVPVSTWVTSVIEDRLEDAELERLWAEFYRSVRPRREDVRRGEAIFRGLTKPRRKKAAA